MPRQARILGECRACTGGERETRSQLAVERIARGSKQRERIGAAVEEDGDEDLLLRAGRCSGSNPLVEHLRPQRAAPVDREREPDPARDERASIEAGARGHRHSRLDRR